MALVVWADFHWPGGRRVKVKSRSPASSRLSATARHFSRHFSHDRPAPSLHIGGGLGVDHVAVVRGQLVMKSLGRMREQVAVLVNRAALDRDVGPQRGQRRLEPGRAVDDEELGRPQAAPGSCPPGRRSRRRCSRRPWPSGRAGSSGRPGARRRPPAARWRSPCGQSSLGPPCRRGRAERCPRRRARGRSTPPSRSSPCAKARLTTSLPTAPSNSAARARRTRRVLVPARYAPAISASARLVRRWYRRRPFERHSVLVPSSWASRARGTRTVSGPNVPDHLSVAVPVAPATRPLVGPLVAGLSECCLQLLLEDRLDEGANPILDRVAPVRAEKWRGPLRRRSLIHGVVSTAAATAVQGWFKNRRLRQPPETPPRSRQDPWSCTLATELSR